MTLPDRDDVLSWVGLPVTDAAGEGVGTCTAVYADDSTGMPEWALVDGADSGLRFLPLVDARVEGDSLRVGVSAERIESAPRLGSQGHLSEEEEAQLYQHYGVPYSAGPSDTVLPSAVGESADVTGERREYTADTMPPMEPGPLPTPQPVVPEPTPQPLVPSPPPQPLQDEPTPEPLQPEPSPEPPRRESSPSPTPPSPTPPTPAPPRSTPPPASRPPLVDAGAPRRGRPAEGLVGAGAGLVTAVVLLLRERRRPGSRSSRSAGVRKAGATLGAAASVITGAAEALGSQVGRATGPVGETASDVAKTGSRAVGRAADSTRDVAVTARREVRRSWRRTTTRVLAVTGAASGYLLGARAGQRRYEQIRATASRLGERLRGSS